MALEIERKFLVNSNNYKIGSKQLNITQAYLKIEQDFAIRIRVQDVHGTLTIKSKISDRVNKEFEYDIPIDEARILLSKGAKEICLLGQNVNAYHANNGKNEWNLASLIKEIANLDVTLEPSNAPEIPKEWRDKIKNLIDAEAHYLEQTWDLMQRKINAKEN